MSEEVQKKKLPKKLPIIAGVVVAVLAVACVGGLVWHEQPSFCNAICHTPMDGYLQTLEATPGESATDKWGNEVEDASSMLASVHASCDESYTCLDCHVPTLSEQISEGVSWVTGDYEVYWTGEDTYTFVPEEKDLEQLTEARGSEDSSEFCLNEDCHDVTVEDLEEATAEEYATRNPHEMPHGTLQCSTCHKAHRASVNYCSQCHSDAVIPEGWLSWSEYSEIDYY